MLSFQQLTTPVTSDQMEEEIIQRLSEIGFSSRGWQSGSPQLSMVKLLAWLSSRFTVYADAIARAGVNDTATGDFLKRYSLSQYQNTKKPAVAEQQLIRHTTLAGQGPYPVDIGDLKATDGKTVYVNIEAGTLTSAAPVNLIYEAEIPGAAGHAGPNTIVDLVSTVAGVTITNPDAIPVRGGADEESDKSLRERNSTRWATLAIDMPADGYRNVALGVDGIERVAVDDTNPRGPGTVDVYVAGAAGPADPGAQANAQLAIDKRRSVTAKSSGITSGVIVQLPSTVSVVVAGIVYVDASYIAGAQDLVRAAVEDYINAVDIGGESLDGVHRGITEDGITAAIRAVTGVKNVDLTAPLADLPLNAFDLAVPNTSALFAQVL